MTPRKTISALATISALTILAGCDAASPVQGDVYLPEGNAENGRELFVSLGCAECHGVVGANLPRSENPDNPRVLLGSTSGRTMSYGRLVTSIVNPSHKLTGRYRSEDVSVDGESKMTSYNDVVTVSQLTDLVAFLQSHYEAAERPGYKYRVYDYSAADEKEATE